MGLTVALDDNGTAQGLLYWDDGTTIGKYKLDRLINRFNWLTVYITLHAVEYVDDVLNCNTVRMFNCIMQIIEKHAKPL